ncbi:response regulator [Streptomyces formicae]|uniref:DNA-binding response regulator, LuxR family n=1 Tax=Streptomyces formicae TaxID=1616117 RepID=A0A291QD36_9ACTN|nr:response regulator transcription factor [Streptomyces formicae]ATL29426.1 DNA-binding response regulator, LuxR family [Streptomyces formicae]
MTTPPVSETPTTIRVLLADDEEMIRHGVRMILQHADGIEVVGEAVNGAEAVTLAAELRPDVALVDIRMPVLDGLAAIAPLIALDPRPQVVMLTTFGDEENVTRALQAGAGGFLLKDEGPDELIRSVRAAAAGDAVLSPGVTGTVIKRMLQGGAAPAPSGTPGATGPASAEDRVAALTDREREVLAMLGAGLPNLEIGLRLGIGVGTVKTHVAAILEKTDSDSRVQAALLAHRAGLAS